MNQPPSNEGTHPKDTDVHWRAVWVGYALSAAGTLGVGGGLFALEPDVWRIALTGTGALFFGGFVAGMMARTPEPLNGALIGLLYFGTFVLVMFFGASSDALPDPLPGLPLGDSTFFFVWPLLMLVGSVVGSALGGRWRRIPG